VAVDGFFAFVWSGWGRGSRAVLETAFARRILADRAQPLFDQVIGRYERPDAGASGP